MEELEVTWYRSVKVWWSITWRIVVYSLLLGFVVSIPLDFAATMAGLESSAKRLLTQAAGTVCGFIIAVWAVKIVLGKQFYDFRIMLVPSDTALLRQKGSGPARAERLQ